MAAGLKVRQLLDTPIQGHAWLTSHSLEAIQIQAEIVFGAFLISGIAPRLSRLLTIFVFTIFAGVSGFQAWRGAESCGCFGNVSVDPLWVFLMDIGIVQAAFWMPFRRYARSGNKSMSWLATSCFAAITLLGGAGLIASMQHWDALRLTGSDLFQQFGGEPSGGERTFYAIDPRQLIDRPFDLANHVKEGQQLRTGSWVVMFKRPDCSHCHQIIERFVAQGMSAFNAGPTFRVCFVDVVTSREPPLRVEHPEIFESDTPPVETALTSTFRWVVETPLVVYVVNDVVVACADFDSLTAAEIKK